MGSYFRSLSLPTALAALATDLLVRDPAPTEAAGRPIETSDGGSGRLGREVAEKEASPEAVGARPAKVDGVAKLTGNDRFGVDVLPEEAVLASRAVRNSHARLTLGDPGPLLAAHPGLVRVLAAADVPGHNLCGIYPTGKDRRYWRNRLSASWLKYCT